MCRVKENILFNKIRNIMRNPKYLEMKNSGCGEVVTDIFWKMVKIAYICDEKGELWYDAETPFCVDTLVEVLNNKGDEIRQTLEIFKNLGLIEHNEGVITITVWI